MFALFCLAWCPFSNVIHIINQTLPCADSRALENSVATSRPAVRCCCGVGACGGAAADKLFEVGWGLGRVCPSLMNTMSWDELVSMLPLLLEWVAAVKVALVLAVVVGVAETVAAVVAGLVASPPSLRRCSDSLSTDRRNKSSSSESSESS